MIRCPVCEQLNDDNNITCGHCRRYLPQIQNNMESLLVSFLRKNEIFFTILGVFLVLTLIFNSPQLIELNFSTPQSSNATLNCSFSVNAIESTTSNLSEFRSINCSSTILEQNPKKNLNASDLYTRNARTFSFLCLWVSMIIFFVIFYSLWNYLKISYNKIRSHILDFKSKDEFLQDCSIWVILIPFIGIGFWFILLLFELFPEMIANALIVTIFEIYTIEILFFGAVLISCYKQRMNDKKKILKFSLFCIGFSIFISCFFYFMPGMGISYLILVFPMIILCLLTGFVGINHYRKI
jgi:hypothetical protein